MYPFLSKIFYDNESLHEYERNETINGYTIDFKEIKRRLIAIERLENPMRNDIFYESLGYEYLDKYESLSDFLFDMPHTLAKDFLCYKEGAVFVKKERFTEWMELISYIPPALFIAAFLWDFFKGSYINNKQQLHLFTNQFLSQFAHTVQPLAYIPELAHLSGTSGLHDLHIHLNGSTESDSVWLYMLANPYKSAADFKKVYYKKESIRKHNEQTISNDTPENLLIRLKVAKNIRSSLCYKLAIDYGVISTEDTLQRNQYRTLEHFDISNLLGNDLFHTLYTPLNEEVLFYIIMFSHLKDFGDEIMANEFYHYLLIKGIVHRLSVMQISQIGFPQFQLITDNTFRDGIESFYNLRFMQLAGGGPLNYLGLIEGRFSPRNSKTEMYALLNRIDNGFKQFIKRSNFSSNAKLILVAHFIKKKDSFSTNSLPIRHRELRTELKRKSLVLSSFIANQTHLSTLIKGIDAAASEFDAGPEVFSHAFRFLKKHGISYCTFHAGEDFSHILSGIRTIYEAVTFLDMEHGDRLGHCTAIGIEPNIWIKRTGKLCCISQGEWLDNLVFSWHLIKTSQIKELYHCIPFIESSIKELSSKIYGKDYPPYELVEAWKLRKFNPFIYLEDKGIKQWNDWYCVETPEEKDDIISKIFVNDSQNTSKTNIGNILSTYHRFNVINNNPFGNEYDKVIEITVDEIFDHTELMLLQDIVLDFLARKGIVIEALPTSNLRISYYKKLEEYHLSKWLKGSSKEELMTPSVVLGTDDPGIFTTNIFNEYAYSYLLLQEKCVTSTPIYNLIENLHRNSLIYNFLNHDR